jgi:hypothetical protein
MVSNEKLSKINSHQSQKGYVIAEKNPSWLNWIVPERFNDLDLFRIVVFFVFHSPVEGISAMRKPLELYGWDNPWQKPVYLNRKLTQASTNPSLLFPAPTLRDMSQALQKSRLLDEFPSDLNTERICFYNAKSNYFLSIFYHIRNTFAHGRLNMIDIDNDCVFILEDVTRARELRVSARMILRKSTLIKWINIIEMG